MAKVSRNQLKAWFRKGLYPLESQFHAWIDSFWHKDDTLPVTAVEGLADALNGKADRAELEGKQDKTDLSLETSDKTVAGAINELLAIIHEGGGGCNCEEATYEEIFEMFNSNN